jgi:peptidoglycan/xylan/chitin deacetylase (PgdA/CDA1 family)
MNLIRKYKTINKLKALRNSPVLVLAYHNIVNQNRVGDDLYSVTTRNFEKHLRGIKKFFNCITLAQFVSPEKSKRPRILITFDDGHHNNYSEAFPLLKKAGLSAVFFISGGLAGKEGFMTWDEIKEMQKAGMEFGSHGFGHRNFAELTEAETKNELEKSKQALEENLSVCNPCFAYPFGGPNHIKDRDKIILKETGYSLAFLFGGGAFRTLPDIYRIPRMMVIDWQGITFLEKITETFYRDLQL